MLRATAGRYVTRIASGVGNSTSVAGNPAFFGWLYGGPAINPDPNAPNLISSGDALDVIFDWFDSVGGAANRTFLFDQNIPGSTSRVDGSLDSPNADELTVGFSKRLGSRGQVRADYVRRERRRESLRRTSKSERPARSERRRTSGLRRRWAKPLRKVQRRTSTEAYGPSGREETSPRSSAPRSGFRCAVGRDVVGTGTGAGRQPEHGNEREQAS